jgi:hypothetical protein
MYSASDTAAPVMSGSSGSLNNLLHKCLVQGYGSKLPVGWSLAYSSASSGNMVLATFRQGTGSMNYLYVNDNGPGAGGTTEARITGYPWICTVCGTGSNPFPTGSAMTVARKSANIATVRNWRFFADSSSFYSFIQTDTAGTWQGFSFGDLYMPPALPISTSQALIVGKVVENTTTAAGDRLDTLQPIITTAVTGHFMSGNAGSMGTVVAAADSITVGKMGGYPFGGGASAVNLLGAVVYPNSCNNAVILSPVWVYDNVGTYIRGTMRGFWQFCHAIANVTDAQNITGSGDLVGRKFHILKQSGNSGVYCIETSNTVETS